MRHVVACSTHDPALYRRFSLLGHPVGFIRHDFKTALAGFDDVFEISDTHIDFIGDEAELAGVVRDLHDAGYLKMRNELYAIKEFWHSETLMRIDRGAVWFFGIQAYGVHVNGIVRKPDGLHLWIARRAADREIAPGKLDCMVGGGMTAGLSPLEVVIKESAEEAGLSEEIAAKAQPVGAISYCFDAEKGLKNDTLFIYDLFLDADVTPRNTDGETQSFKLLPIAEVARLVRETDEFKFNCNLVLTDFFIRHGYLDASEPEYVELCKAI